MGKFERQTDFEEASDEDLLGDEEDLIQDNRIDRDEHGLEGKCDIEVSQDLEDGGLDGGALQRLSTFRSAP